MTTPTSPPFSSLSADAQTVFDALSFAQSPLNITRLAELLRGHPSKRGTQLQGPELRKLLGELLHAGRVSCNALTQWLAAPEPGMARFVQLVQDDALRERWWQSWKQLTHFDNSWHLELFDEMAMVGALRVVVYGGGTPEAFDRLVRLSRNAPAESPGLLAIAFMRPFQPALWEALDPELRFRLVINLLNHLTGDCEASTQPLWQWLLAQSQPDAGVLHDVVRLQLAEHLILVGQRDEARRVLLGVDEPAAQALRACADIAEGHYANGTLAFELAWKERAALSGKRKHLFTDASSWFYLVALIAQSDPALWGRARKFAAGEAGKRDADALTFWGVWQEAIDQRLGDAPRNVRTFALAPLQHMRMHGLEQLSHMLLVAWLGLKPSQPAVLAGHAGGLAEAYDKTGRPWLAMMVRRATALLLGAPALPGDAAQAFPISPPKAPWREALNAIVALGAVGGGPSAAGGQAEPDRLIWTLRANSLGEVRQVVPLEQKAGVRGLGKPKKASLLALAKRTDLPAHDAAVLRALKKMPYGGRLVINKLQAVQALVRHPHVAWAETPLQFIELSESLPQLEVMTRGEFLQFRVIDPVRPDAAALAAASREMANEHDNDDDDSDDDDDLLLYRRVPDAIRPTVLLMRDGDERARLLRLTPAQLRVAELVSQGWQVPVAARAEMDAALRVLGTHFSLASDADAGAEVPASAVLRAELTPQGMGLTLRVVAAPFGDFGPRPAPAAGRERLTTVHQGLTLSTRRDLAAERSHLQALTDSADWLDEGSHQWSLDEPEQALATVEALGRLGSAQCIVEWPKGKAMTVRAVSAKQLVLKVRSQGDWLEIEGDLPLDGAEVLRLRQLLELMAQGKSRYVALGNGAFLALTDTLRQQLVDLRAVVQNHGSGAKATQRLSALAAIAWSGQADAPSLGGDKAWQARCQAWELAQTRHFEVPAGFIAELRDYQSTGFTWLMRLAASGFGAVLADDMGLGKTLQSLALLVSRAEGGPALVLAPTSVCGNWLAEAARFAPGLQFEMYGSGSLIAEPEDEANEAGAADGSAADATAAEPNTQPETARQATRRKQVLALGPGQVLVCSYGLLQIDGEILASRDWHTAVIDEAQAIKNPGTRRAKAAHHLSADFKLALTGTPIENRLGELWSIMAFANPGLLGSLEQFNQRFAGPIERDSDPQAGRRLRRLIAPFLLRRTKTEVLSDLPPRTEIVHDVVPGSRERSFLEALRQQAEESVAQALAATAAGGTSPVGEGQAQMHVLAALTRLRRAACDPRLVAPELGLVGAKVQEFERLALELVAGHHKALVFSQFTDFLALLRERLDACGLRYQYLDGSTPAAQRTQRVNAFQAGQGDFFLISLKAGGFGLNLTMADYVIIADPWWNPAAEDQASGRAHRIGQQRPVTVYRLVTQGSIEDRIVKLHHSKRALAEGVLGAGQDGGLSGGGAMRAADMLALLRGEDGVEE